MEGTASWNSDMVREFFKDKYKVDVPTVPAPYANQSKLNAVNPEFARRVEALMALYQALGGGTDFGIEPADGGLRTNQRQIELFKQCRRIRKGPDPRYLQGDIKYHHVPYDQSNGPIVGDGSKKEDWELIPVDDRITSRKSPSFTFDARGNLVGLRYDHEHSDKEKDQNCGLVSRVKTGRVRGDYMEVWGPSTGLWFSWHNVGLAVDLRDEQDAVPLDPAGAKLFLGAENGVGDLGMINGGWWKTFPDLGHVEWHPKVRYPYRFESQGGLALGNDQIDMGYKWKIPTKIYTWTGQPAPTPNALTVHELVEDSGWVAVKKIRRLFRYENGNWTGSWETYDPPVRLFPAYIPTIRYQIWAHQSPVVRKGKVTTVTYSQDADPDGRVTKDLREYREEGVYSHESVYIEDWQKKANIASETKSDNAPGYVRLWNTSVYAIDSRIRGAQGLWSERAQGVDADGYTTERDWSAPYAASTFVAISVCLAWDRDNGKIGGAVELMKQGSESVYDITEVTHDSNSREQGCEGEKVAVSAQLPKGAWDRETPPGRAPSNPRPKGVAPPRCPPGAGCLPPP